MKGGAPGDAPRRVALLFCITLGGSAALSWEVLWQIKSSLALGVSARGTAITLATTMAGMGLGAILGGRLLRDRPPARPARLYGRIEAVIGVSGLAMPAGFVLLEGLDAWIYGLAPSLASGLHAVGIALLLGPPTVAMGATVPVFGVLARRYETSLSQLYALNTAGASLGVIGFTFLVVPALGVGRTVVVVALINFAVAAIAHTLREPALDADAQAPPPVPVPVPVPAAGTFPVRLATVIAFGTGFVTFGLEVAWFRSLRAAFQSSADSFAIILASVLVPLALGARLVPWIRRIGVPPAALLCTAGVAILLATPIVERMDLFVASLQVGIAGPGGYVIEQLARLLLALAVLGPPILVLGTVLPWLLDELETPEQAGRLYGANTLGAACGSLAAAWALLPTLGFAYTAWILGAATVLLSLPSAGRRLRIVGSLAGAAACVVAVASGSSVGRDRVQTPYDWDRYQILSYDEGPDSTISVVDRGEDGRYLLIDGFAASGENASWGDYMELMGRLPMLVHEDPGDALVIGFGTGQTAHGVRDERPRRLDIAELNRAVLDAAPHFETNHSVLEDPVVHAIVMDGRAWLRRTSERYDVITLEPMPPHFAGVNALYSREFYEILASRLRPGGVACQWVPLHLLPPYHAASVARTFTAVFPDAELWVVPHGQGILLGRRPGAPGGETSPTARLALRRELDADTELRLGPRALALFAENGGVISDDSQLLAYGRVQAERRLYGSPQMMMQRNFEQIARLSRIRE